MLYLCGNMSGNQLRGSPCCYWLAAFLWLFFFFFHLQAANENIWRDCEKPRPPGLHFYLSISTGLFKCSPRTFKCIFFQCVSGSFGLFFAVHFPQSSMFAFFRIKLRDTPETLHPCKTSPQKTSTSNKTSPHKTSTSNKTSPHNRGRQLQNVTSQQGSPVTKRHLTTGVASYKTSPPVTKRHQL
jgi:hypothetical protein